MSDTRRWVFGSIAAIALVLSAVLVSRGPSRDTSPVPSTYSVGTEGCKGLYLTLEELKLPVSRWRKPLDRLGDQAGVMVVIDPRRMALKSAETTKLKQWVKDGNRLVIFQGRASEPAAEKEKKADTKKSSASRERGYANDWARSFGLSMKAVNDSERKNLPVSFSAVDGPGLINVSGAARWNKPTKSWTTLASDDQGAVVLSRKWGKGEVSAVSDASLPSNAHLPAEKNLRFVLALLLANGPPKAIIFDEYHHGHILSDNLLTYAGSSVFSWIVIQCFVGFTLLLFSRRAGETGKYQSLSPSLGRSSLEHVDSMANIFESCNAAPAALEAIASRFRADLSRRTGVRLKDRESRSWDDIAEAMPNEYREAAAVLALCDRAARSPVDAEKALALARALGAARAGFEHDRISRARGK